MKTVSADKLNTTTATALATVVSRSLSDESAPDDAVLVTGANRLRHPKLYRPGVFVAAFPQNLGLPPWERKISHVLQYQCLVQSQAPLKECGSLVDCAITPPVRSH